MTLVDFNCREMHLIWWLLCQVQGIIWRYDLVIARHAAVFGRLLLGIHGDFVDLELANVQVFEDYSGNTRRLLSGFPFRL